jgi:small-conductance mechanosensitive channel
MNMDEYKKNFITYLIKFGISILIVIIFYIIAVISKKNIIKKIENEQKKILLYHFLSSLTYYLIITVGILIGAYIIGFNINSLLVIFGTIGLVIALSCKNILGDIVAGLKIIIFNYYDNDNLVETNNMKKNIRSFDLINTTFYDATDIKTIISNSNITNKKFLNYNSNEEIFCETKIKISNNNNVDYDILIEKIKEGMINNCEYLIKSEGNIFVIISDISSSGTDLLIKFLIKSKNHNKANFSAQKIIRDVLTDNSVLLVDKSYL